MNRVKMPTLVSQWFAAMGAIAFCLSAAQGDILTQAQKDSGWVELFNGRDWTGVSGSLGNDATGDGWKKFFKIMDSGVVQVPTSPQTYGYIETDKDYSRYIVRSQYKFYNNPKNGDNSGLLYHCSGPMPGGNEWPPTLELQYKLGEGGRLWIMKGPRIKSYMKDNKYAAPKDGGTLVERGGSGYQTVEGRLVNNKMNDWNEAELRVYGSDSSVHILNGEVIFRGHDIQNEDKSPRTAGRIRLQAEGAGVYHRNWIIMELDAQGKPKNAKTPVELFALKKNRLRILAPRSQFGAGLGLQVTPNGRMIFNQDPKPTLMMHRIDGHQWSQIQRITISKP